MKDQKKELASVLAGALDNLTEEEITGLIETPPDSAMGDFAFPCFKLAKIFRKAPQMIAQELAEKLSGNSAFAEVKNVNAYVNFFMNRAEVEADVVKSVLDKGEDYGKADIGGNKPVIVEFSSPNIAKPFHIGHIGARSSGTRFPRSTRLWATM